MESANCETSVTKKRFHIKGCSKVAVHVPSLRLVRGSCCIGHTKWDLLAVVSGKSLKI